ncbi:MAG: hypothetical protein ACFE91_10000 [Promethearchaeota archaeon]
MKRINSILIGILTFTILFTIINVNTVLATSGTPIPVSGTELYQYQVQANHSLTWQFQLKTRLTVHTNISIQGFINCSEAPKIGDKHFEIEIDAEDDLQMNMTCTEEQKELGLLLGNRYTVRNRNRNLLYQEGFCIRIQNNASIQNQIHAQLKIQANNRNREGTWAFYNGTAGQWEAVPTMEQDGYLICETNHFSTWTILLPETDDTIWGFIGFEAVFIGSVVVAVGLVIYLKKRK